MSRKNTVRTMRVTVAVDSFKGSLSSIEAGFAVKKGILRVYSDAEITICPLADGGEGTSETLLKALDGTPVKIRVNGPLGAAEPKVDVMYSILPDGKTAAMDVSRAAGLTLVPEEKRNPLNTTTYGVGEMIRDAVGKGVRHFIIGIGGTSTNDGGSGMLTALGYRFLDKNNEPVDCFGRGLENLAVIDETDVLPELSECDFRIACDVINPLCGQNGASAVFGPQKGATPQIIANMDKWLEHYADIAEQLCGRKAEDIKNVPGAGAAGGLGFAFLAFMNASLESGIKIIMDVTNMRDKIRNSDIVITGEGRLDSQTAMGKAPAGIASIAKEYNKPVIAVSGSVSKGAEQCNQKGIDAFFPILRNIIPLETAMRKDVASDNLSDTIEQIFRLIKVEKNCGGIEKKPEVVEAYR
jgi:glycerate kinase